MASRCEATENAAAPAAFECNRRGLARKKSRGSSIIEMMVAIFVLMIVLISMFSMFLISRTAIYNKEDETANAIALRYMEEMEGRPFTTFTETFSETKDFGKYSAEATVIDKPNDYIVTVQVEVEWDAAVMGSKTLTLTRTISSSGSMNTGMQSTD